MKWCCSSLQDLHGNAGRHGLSIVFAEAPNGQLLAVLQGRPVDDGKEDALKVLDDLVITVVSQHFVAFCPFCGRKISRWYRKHSAELNCSHLLVGSEYLKE